MKTGQIDPRGVRPGPGQARRAAPRRRRRRRRRPQLDAHRALRQEVPGPLLQRRHRRVEPGRRRRRAGRRRASGPGLASFAAFVMCNAYDQLRMSVAFPCLDVKVVGTHAGISIGEDGPSQMGIEDVGLACSLPDFTVVVPADEPSTMQGGRGAGARSRRRPTCAPAGPTCRSSTTNGCAFQLGKANQLRDGKDVTIIANGLMVAAALEAAEKLAGQGVQARVLDMHTVKPLDDAAVLAAAQRDGPHRRRRGAPAARRPGQRRGHVGGAAAPGADALRRPRRHLRRVGHAGGAAGRSTA